MFLWTLTAEHIIKIAIMQMNLLCRITCTKITSFYILLPSLILQYIVVKVKKYLHINMKSIRNYFNKV